MAVDPYSLDSLKAAAETVKKCQEGRITLSDLKARLPPRDAPYQEHRSDSWVGFEKSRTIPIPTEVFEGIKGASPTATQALFPEIRRACITVDNKLYLWNYLEGQSAFEYHHLPEDQVILSVGVVPARAGVFIEAIKHVLILSTGFSAQEGRSFTLLGLEFTSKDGISEVKLYETGIKVNTNGVILSEIQGTSGGRIFASGSDHCLYELVYQANEGWFSNKCYLRNVTSPKFSNLLPTFMKAEKRLDRIAVDDARNLVYTLREGCDIDVFNLPSKDSTSAPVKTGSTQGTTKQIGLTHSQADVGSIVWIGPAERDVRTGVVLIAVTEKGHRIFFDDFQGRTWAPLQVRAPPGLTPQNSSNSLTSTVGQQVATQAGRTVSSVLCAGDVFMIGFNYSGAPGQISCITPAPAGPSMSGSAVEAATIIDLELALSAPIIAEARPWKPYAQISQTGELIRPTVSQTLQPPRSFLVLDNNGLSELVERRPVDLLKGLLEMGMAMNSAVIMEFFSMFGPIEACTTALSIAAHNSQVAVSRITIGSLNTANATVKQVLTEEVISQASRIFFSQYGSWPADARMPTTLASTRTSRHDGLALYVACLFKRFWDKLIVPPEAPKPGTKPAPASTSTALTPYSAPSAAATVKKVSLKKENLEEALQDLVPLLDFMQRHSKLFGIGSTSTNRSFMGGNGMDYDQERAAKMDQESFERIKALTSRSIEAINFVLFLMDHGLMPLINACSEDAKKILASLQFGQLLTTSDGKRASKELVTALIEARIGAQVSIDAVADALQSRCGSFCSGDDVRQYKATECIRKAKETRSEKEKAEQLRLSQRLLSKGAGQLTPEKLKAICDDYRKLGYPIGVVDIALKCAQDWDPAGVAIAYRAEGCPDGQANAARKKVWDKRKLAYSMVFDTLKELDDQLDAAYNFKGADAQIHLEVEKRDKIRSDAYARVESSQDPLFHEQLYAWLIERKLTDQLLQLRTPYLAEYLTGQPAADKANDITYIRTLRNLLWQYYVRNGEYFAAAQVLDALAHSKEFGLQLKERIEYLALAVGNAKSVGPAHDVVAFLSQVDEDLEVAQVQAKILHSLQQLNTGDQRLAQSIEWLDDELLDLSTLYKNFAEPFELLEEQLMIIGSAEYQDINLVAETWTALITREHKQNGAQHAHKAISVLVRDLFTRLGRAENACPVDVVLDLLMRYAFEQEPRAAGQRIENPVPVAWAPKNPTDSPIPVGWASVTLMLAGASGEFILDVLEGAISTAPPPWNTNAGHHFLITELAEFIHVWIKRNLDDQRSGVENDANFPVDRLFETLNALIVKFGTGKDQETLDKLRSSIDTLKVWY